MTDLPMAFYEWIRWDWLWMTMFWVAVTAVVIFVFKIADYWISSWQTDRWYRRTYNPRKSDD